MAITTVHNELIAVNAISGTAIADNAVTSVHIAQNNVGTVQIALNSVTSVSIALNQVTGTQIANNAITSTQLADNAVTATKVPDGTQFALGATSFTGAITTNSTVDGIDIATRDAILTSTTTTAGAALPKAGGAMTGAITTNSTFDGVDIATRDAVLTSTTTTANAAAPLANPTLTGTPAAPTASGSTSTTQLATTAFVQQELTTLIGGAPSTLNDLNELAAAINDDANYNSTLTTALATKLPLAGGTMTGDVTFNGTNLYFNGAASSASYNLALENSDTFTSFYGSTSSSIDKGYKFFTGNQGADLAFTINADRSIAIAGTLGVTGATTFTNATNTIQADDAFLRIEEADGTDIAYLGDLTGAGVGGLFLYNHGGTATTQLRSDTTSSFNSGGANVVASFTSTDGTGAIQLVDNGGNVELAAVGSDFHVMNAGGAAKMVVLNSGSVGIGTAAPQRKLVLYEATSAQTQIQFQNSTTGAATGDGFGVGLDSAEKGFIWNYEGNDTYIGGAGGTSITIQNAGNVGIGTTGPTTYLDVRAPSGVTTPNVAYFKSDQHGLGVYVNIGSTFSEIRSNNNSYPLVLNASSGGNVGIGTTSPNSYLATELVVAAADEGGITIANTASSHKANIYFADGTSGSARNRGNVSYDHNTDALSFGTAAGHSRMVIDNAGAITIGGTLGVTGAITANGGAVFNELGADVDFRVESSNYPYMLQVDASTDRVGVGFPGNTHIPQKTLHVFQTEGSVGADHATIRLGGYTTTGCDIAAYRHDGNSNNQGLKFSTYDATNGSVEKLRIEPSGITKFLGKDGGSTHQWQFTNNGLGDASYTNCSVSIQGGNALIQLMAWGSNGARIGTRGGGWSGTADDVHLTAHDAACLVLKSNGVAYLADGSTSVTSDQRLKKNITSMANGQLANINALTVRNFEMKDDRKPGVRSGLIAQEVESVISEAVEETTFHPDPDDTSRDFEGDVKIVRYGDVQMRLLKAVQELSAELTAAKARITALEE